MKLEVGNRVLTPEGTGFVDVVEGLSANELMHGIRSPREVGGEMRIVRLDTIDDSNPQFAPITEVTEVFGDSTEEFSTLREQQAHVAAIARSDAREALSELGRPTKVSYLRIIK